MDSFKVMLYNRVDDEMIIKYPTSLKQAIATAFILSRGFKKDTDGTVTVYVNDNEYGHIGGNCNIFLKKGRITQYSILGYEKYQIFPNGTLKKL